MWVREGENGVGRRDTAGGTAGGPRYRSDPVNDGSPRALSKVYRTLLAMMRASISSTQEPMTPESRPSRLIASSPGHPWLIACQEPVSESSNLRWLRQNKS